MSSNTNQPSRLRANFKPVLTELAKNLKSRNKFGQFRLGLDWDKLENNYIIIDTSI